MPLRNDPAASAQVITLMVAGAIFLAAIGGMLLVTRQTGSDGTSAHAADKDVEAGNLADLLLTSPGVGWSSGADSISRLGLGASNGSGLDPASLAALRGAMTASTSNGKVDYQDAQRSLGMDPAGTQQFHIRMYPVGMDTVYDTSLSGMRTAYIGDWSSLISTPIILPVGTSGASIPVLANAALNSSMQSTTLQERQAIDALGLDFNNQVYIVGGSPAPLFIDQPLLLPDLAVTSTFAGDVYPDLKVYLDAVLASQLCPSGTNPCASSPYDMLIVGSGVDQNTMTANAVKSAIANWVLAGGTLVVLGSDGQNYQWLQPLFAVGVSTVNGAPTAPDVSHPLLKEPNDLAWTSYNTHGFAWDIKDTGNGAHYDDFSHVVLEGGEDVLAVSKEGAFGEGRILLTTFRPGEFATGISMLEAENFFENVALYADHTGLYLEYGPTISSAAARSSGSAGLPVSVAVRDTWLWDERLGQVPVRLEVHTWSS